MRNLWVNSLGVGLVCVALLMLVQGPQPAAAKKIKAKKILKELKKLKKYGYLLAGQRNKLYAIPFPMPLPIFVKRQHIYTSYPVIPRYIQHPHPSGSYGSSSSSYASLASSSSEPAAAASPPPHYHHSDAMSSYTPDLYAPSSQKYSSYGYPARSKSKKYTSDSSSSSTGVSSYFNAIPTSSKYLSQLMGALGQSAGASLGGSGTSSGAGSASASKDLLTKIMNGQAKILPPSSLLSAIKGPSSALLGLYQQSTGSSSSSSSPSSSSSSSSSSSLSSPSSSSTDEAQDPKGESAGSSSSSSSSGTTFDDSPTSGSVSASSSSSKTHDSSETNKPSASELHKSRFKPYMIRTPYGRIPVAAANMMANMNPMMAQGMMAPPPMPAMFPLMAAASQSPAMMQRIPMLQPAGQLMTAADGGGGVAGAGYLPMVVPVSAQMVAQNPADHMETQSTEINESYAAGGQPGHDGANISQEDQLARYRAALMLRQRRQALLKLAVLREREDAVARLVAESQGQPSMARLQATHLLLNHQLKQHQQLRHLQQLHQLHQQQRLQQLQQNTIDR